VLWPAPPISGRPEGSLASAGLTLRRNRLARIRDMYIRYGYRIDAICQQQTPFIAMLDVHPDRRADVTDADGPVATALSSDELIDASELYIDQFGNICRRITASPGGFSIRASGTIYDGGFADAFDPQAQALPPEKLPPETLVYLLGSRYCETDRLSDQAWALFGAIPGGWLKVQSICDYVHQHIRFNYQAARPTRTAYEAFNERVGVCRDYAHLALTLCRCLNIPGSCLESGGNSLARPSEQVDLRLIKRRGQASWVRLLCRGFAIRRPFAWRSGRRRAEPRGASARFRRRAARLGF
jgi:transglutaminase-like putative cysteine protease